MKKGAAVVAILLGVLSIQAMGVSRPAVQRSPLARMVEQTALGHPQWLPNGRIVPMPSTGYEQAVLEATGLTSLSAKAKSSGSYILPQVNTSGCSSRFTSKGVPANTRVNQDCGFRFQSEEWVAVNPTDPKNIVASTNDSLYSGNRTSVHFSIDGGKHWGSSGLPVGRVNIDAVPGGQWSFDAMTDPAHAWDAEGNLYYSAVAFDAFQDGFSSLVVWKSNSCLKGSALHTPGSGACEPSFVPPIDATGVDVHDNFADPLISDDKELMAADHYKSSPFKNNVYITWTIFRFDDTGLYLESPIFFTRSEDGGQTWTAPLEISGNSPDCVGGDSFDPTLPADACNFSQGSYPLVGPDGKIYVAFNNCNTAEGAPLSGAVACQQMLVKSADGGDTWTAPVVVGKDVATQPFSVPDNEIPDCPLFRQCLPPNGYRLSDFPSIGIDERNGRLAVFWADFRSGGPCATDATYGVPVLPCDDINNDVVVSISKNGGKAWSRAHLVTHDPAAQWQPWGDVGENGALHVGYYDRGYGKCEKQGCNDITLASSEKGSSWTYRRITTSSMPNLTCKQNAPQCGFLGDYMSIQATNDRVYLVWGDTRGRGLGNIPDDDLYFAKVKQ